MLVVGNGAYGTVYLVSEDKVKKSPVMVNASLIGMMPDQVMELSVLKFLRETGVSFVAPVVHDVVFSTTAPTADIFMQRGEVLMGHKAGLPDFGRYVHGLFRRLHALHSVGMFHCDLKPANVIVCDEGGVGTRTAHLIDWGFAKMREHLAFNIFDQGTMSCLAPEILLAERSKVDMEAAEIWSVAALVLQLFLMPDAHQAAKCCPTDRMLYLPACGYEHLLGAFALLGLPRAEPGSFYHKCSRYAAASFPAFPHHRRKVMKYVHAMPPHLEDLLFQMLDLDPGARPTWSNILTHPFMRHYDSFVVDAVASDALHWMEPVSLNAKYGVSFMQAVLRWCWTAVELVGQEIMYAFVAEIVCNAIHRTTILEDIVGEAVPSPSSVSSSLPSLTPPSLTEAAARRLVVAALSLAIKFDSADTLEVHELSLLGHIVAPKELFQLESMMLGSAAMPSLCWMYRRNLTCRVTMEARRLQRNLVTEKFYLLMVNYIVGMYPQSFVDVKDAASIFRAHDHASEVDWPLQQDVSTYLKLSRKFGYV